MPHPNWTLLGESEPTDYRIFRIRKDRYRFEPTGETRGTSSCWTSPAWVNVVPVTPAEGNVVLIRQYRHGIREVMLEIPGGRGGRGKSTEDSGGQGTGRGNGLRGRADPEPWRRVLPNPAVQNNYLFFFTAPGCRKVGPAHNPTGSSPSRCWSGRWWTFRP